MINKIFSNKNGLPAIARRIGEAKAGQSNARDLLIIAAIILAVAALAMSAYIIWGNQKNTVPPVDKDYLEQIKSRLPPGGAGGLTAPASGLDGAGGSAATTAPEPKNQIVSGVLTEIGSDTIVVAEKTANKRMTVHINATTKITYNNQPFDRSRFYVGDQLEITIVKMDENWHAEEIKVIVSANPATAAPVPKTNNVQPDGSIKPL